MRCASHRVTTTASLAASHRSGRQKLCCIFSTVSGSAPRRGAVPRGSRGGARPAGPAAALGRAVPRARAPRRERRARGCADVTRRRRSSWAVQFSQTALLPALCNARRRARRTWRPRTPAGRRVCVAEQRQRRGGGRGAKRRGGRRVCASARRSRRGAAPQRAEPGGAAMARRHPRRTATRNSSSRCVGCSQCACRGVPCRARAGPGV